VEAQAKMSKTLENLLKTGVTNPAKTSKPPPASMAATLKLIQNDTTKNDAKNDAAADAKEQSAYLTDFIEKQKTESELLK